MSRVSTRLGLRTSPTSGPRQGDLQGLHPVPESFFGTCKIELAYRSAWSTRLAVRANVFEYLEVFYNR